MRIVLFFLLSGIGLMVNAQPPELNWTNEFDNIQVDFKKIETDPDNNVIVGGTFNSVVDLDPSVNDFVMTPDPTMPDAFVAKYDASGNFLWGYQMFSNFGEVIDLKTDQLGNVYVYGSFVQNTSLGTSDFFIASGSGFDAFLLKLSPEGLPLYTKTFLANSGAIETMPDNDVLLAISLLGSHDLDGAAGTVTADHTSLIRYNTSGAYEWHYTFYATEVFELMRGSSGNIYVGGYFEVSIWPDPTDPAYSVSTSGRQYFLINLDPIYQLNWMKYGSGPTLSMSYTTTIKEDHMNNVYQLVEYNQENNNLNPTGTAVMASSVNGSYPDYCLMKFSASGTLKWYANLHTVAEITGMGDISLDASGNIYLSGFNAPSIIQDLDPGPGTANTVGRNFLVVYDSTGNYNWHHSYYPSGSMFDMKHTGNGILLMCGYAGYMCDIDFTADTYYPPVSFASTGIVIKYSPHDLNVPVQTGIELKLFPNPASTFITVKSTGPQEVSIWGVDGKLCMRFNAISGEHSESIGHLDKGIYLVKIGSQFGRKLVIE